MFSFNQYPRYEYLDRTFPEIESGDDFYLRCYPKILEAAKTLNDDQYGNSITFLAHAVYGWMPTVLKTVEVSGFFLIDQNPIYVLRKTHLFEDLIERLPSKSPINNSWIGLSKFLHFLNPEVFPIWDSRVAKHFGLKNNSKYNKKDCYEIYAKWLINFSEEHDFQFLKERILVKYGYAISSIRAAELSLFLSSSQKNFDSGTNQA